MKIPRIFHTLLIMIGMTPCAVPAHALNELTSHPDSAAPSVSIEYCYSAAEHNYPLVKRYELIEKTMGYTIENAAKGRLPQLQLNAKAQVQSDVTELPFDFSRLGLAGVDNPKMSIDQYNVNLALSQLIYDGGGIKARQQAAEAQAAVDKQQIRVALYNLREKVNNLYFGILLTDEQQRLNDVLKSNLRLHADQVVALMRGGMAHEADLDAIKAEQLRAEQATVNYRVTREAYVQMLALLTGLPLTNETTFSTPLPARNEAKNAATGTFRPETMLYAKQLEQIGVQRKQLDAYLRPQLSLFAQGGYGRPGLNMLSNKFNLYGVAGVNLTWNISALYTRKNDLQLLDTRSNEVKVAQEVFNYNLDIETAQCEKETERYMSIMAHDDEIIGLRERIRLATEKKLNGGTATATDLMQDVNNEQQARLEQALHKMQYLLATYNLLYCTGDATH